MFTEELPWLGADDKRLIMGAAVRAWWGWPAAGEAPPGPAGWWMSPLFEELDYQETPLGPLSLRAAGSCNWMSTWSR